MLALLTLTVIGLATVFAFATLSSSEGWYRRYRARRMRAHHS